MSPNVRARPASGPFPASVIRLVIILLLALVSLLCLAAPPTRADNPPTYSLVRTIGINKHFFFAPNDVAVASDGTIFVADTGNHRIQVFTSDGTFITTWGSEGNGDGQFRVPHGIAVAADSRVFVADSFNDRIQVFTSDGTFITTWGRWGMGDGWFKHPEGIAVADDGRVFVADTDNHRIQVFTSDGTFITKWGSHGKDDGQFRVPYGIAVAADGWVFVADSSNDRIQVFTSDGTFITKWDIVKDDGLGYLSSSIGITVASDGRVFVADSDNHRIQVFTTGFLFITADIGDHALHNRTLSIDTLPFDAIHFALANKTGTDPLAAFETHTFKDDHQGRRHAGFACPRVGLPRDRRHMATGRLDDHGCQRPVSPGRPRAGCVSLAGI